MRSVRLKPRAHTSIRTHDQRLQHALGPAVVDRRPSSLQRGFQQRHRTQVMRKPGPYARHVHDLVPAQAHPEGREHLGHRLLQLRRTHAILAQRASQRLA